VTTDDLAIRRADLRQLGVILVATREIPGETNDVSGTGVSFLQTRRHSTVFESQRAERLVVRTLESDDRRIATVRLTRKGRAAFQKMARGHERWVDQMFAGVTEVQMEQLMKLLAVVRHSIDERGTE